VPTVHPATSSKRELLNVVDELSRLDPEARIVRFRSLPVDCQQAAFQQLDPAHQDEVLSLLDETQTAKLIEELAPDDRAQLFELLSPARAEQLRGLLSRQKQALTDNLLQYPAESAGRIMSPEFLPLAADTRVSEATEAVRKRGRSKETVFALPVVDVDNRLIGMTTLDELVFAAPETPVRDIMETDVPSVRSDEDQEIVARLMQMSDVLAIPVLDEEQRLLGLVTFDDAMDVLEFEETEDMARTGGAEPLGRPYFAVSLLQLMRSRVVWLLLLALAATLTVNVLSYFEDVLNQMVSLSLFIPLLIGVGGNAGAQSATTIVRAMAVDEVRARDLLRVTFRESRVGLLLGSTLAAFAFAVVWVFFGQSLAIIVSISLVTICTLASLVGSLMPILANRVGVDPAVVSAPFVTTIVDASGLLVYFLIARAVFNI
jgi:magnesium transporter